MRRPRLKLRERLWVRLTVVAGITAVLVQSATLLAGIYVTDRALVAQQAALGQVVAHVVAAQATDLVLVGDALALRELVENSVGPAKVVYCAIFAGDTVLASAGDEVTRGDVLDARRPGETEPVLVSRGDTKILDLAEPMLKGQVGHVRIGIDLGAVAETRRTMVAWLGGLSLAGLTLGALHAYVLGRRISRPVAELLAATDQFEPGGTRPKLPAPSRDELGELTARFVGMMNRLEVLHHEQERAHQKQAGTERLAAIGTLVAGVAHEINNPLAGLKNCLRRIEKGDLTEPRQAEYLEMMADGLARIEAIVRQLLDFARPSVLESTSVHLSQIVRDNVSLLRPTLGQRRVVWDVEVADAAVQADRKKIGQAFLNIALNAAYVTPDGGRLQIRGASRPGQAGLVIIDEGPGIPAHLKERVWDPFYSTKPEGEGTGLGLPVSRSIVEAHGGELTLEDAPGGGTAVTLWLPLALTAPPVSPSPASP